MSLYYWKSQIWLISMKRIRLLTWLLSLKKLHLMFNTCSNLIRPRSAIVFITASMSQQRIWFLLEQLIWNLMRLFQVQDDCCYSIQRHSDWSKRLKLKVRSSHYFSTESVWLLLSTTKSKYLQSVWLRLKENSLLFSSYWIKRVLALLSIASPRLDSPLL